MNTTDAIAALKAGDFHALVNSLDVDQRVTIPCPEQVGGEFLLVRIGRTVIGLAPHNDGSPFLASCPDGTDEDAVAMFDRLVDQGRRAMESLAFLVSMTDVINPNDYATV